MPDPVMYNNEITEVEYSILFCSRSGCVLVHLCKEGKQDGRKENNIDLCGLESFGSTEANSLQGKISNESPVGQALIGKKVGDVVDVETPAGNIRYTVLKIERSI